MKEYDKIGKDKYYRTKKGKKHPLVKTHEQINKGFELAKKWMTEGKDANSEL